MNVFTIFTHHVQSAVEKLAAAGLFQRPPELARIVVEPPRDADGKIDVEGTMQAITSVVEGWVREYPEQWLWVHRRWR